MITNDKGFTLAEVALVILIAVIIIALSSPQVTLMIRNYNFSNDMRTMMAAINRARSQSIQTGLITSVAFFPNVANTQGRYMVFFDNGAGIGGIAGNGLREGNEEIIQEGTLHEGIILDAPAFASNVLNMGRSMSFNSLGLPWGFNAGAPVFFSGTITTNMPSISRTMQLVISTGGSLRIVKV